MDGINFYGLKSKLRLHKIDHEVDEQRRILTLGNHRVNVSRVILGIVLMAAGVSLISILFFVLQVVSKPLILITIAIFLLGVVLVYYEIMKTHQNGNKKTISPGGVTFSSSYKELHVSSHEIAAFEIETEHLKETAKGTLVLKTIDNTRHSMLLIIADDMKHVNDALEFFQKQFVLLVNDAQA